jgi:hypothetical protein
MTVDEFRDTLLRTGELYDLVRQAIFGGEPFVFRTRPAAFGEMFEHLQREIRSTTLDVTVIGSAKTGFSLAPDTFGQPFSATSDIDVIVVDAGLFDLVWHDILAWHYEMDGEGMNAEERKWIGLRMKSLYWGWIEPADLTYTRGMRRIHRFAQAREVSARWFEAFRALSRFPDFARRDVNGRLYRTWQHALLYHVDSLQQVKNTLLQ